MPPTFHLGQLVEIGKIQEKSQCPEVWREEVGDWEPAAVADQQGQLIDWDESTGTWLVMLFASSCINVKEESLAALDTMDVQGFDVALGRMSDPRILGEEIVAALHKKGHAVCRLFVKAEEMEEMMSAAEQCLGEDLFVRLPEDLEPQYLGKGGTGKAMQLDLDDGEDFVSNSMLRKCDDYSQIVGNLLRPHTSAEFGFEIRNRSDTMLWLPFQNDEDRFEAAELENEEAARFLSMMKRCHLMFFMNAGPLEGQLTLMPKIDGERDATVSLQPGMAVVISLDEYKYSYKTDGNSLTVMCWYLDAPSKYNVTGIVEAGDMDLFRTGPPPPRDASRHVKISSMGTRYALGVDSPYKLWTVYNKAGWDTFIEFPFTRWDVNMYYQEGADQISGLSYTRHGGFSDGIELFDCRFFDISPAEAAGMDPTQRQVLEVTYISLQGCGYEKKRLASKPAMIGMWVGLDKNEWQAVPKPLSSQGASSSANAITSNRFSYCLNLKGASMTIDTACSASLVCTHTAKIYLLHNQFDPVEACLVCGVNLLLTPGAFVGCCAAGMLSHGGRCFTYNATADGYARGESTASLSMKPGSPDFEKGELCLLAGSQANQDGRSASLTAPNGPSQEACNRAVIREVGILPREVDTTECHGTGTSLGDPIEIGAYRKVMMINPSEFPVSITCSKSNIGHCEGSAGIGGLLKTVLMSMHCEVCPNVHLAIANPHLDMAGFPAYFFTEDALTKAESAYTGCLSFGFGGTNACTSVWSTNTQTSRGTGASNILGKVQKMLEDAPCQEVHITGDDWEEWEIHGPDPRAAPGQSWHVELNPSGSITFVETRVPDKELGSLYYVTGTFNNWSSDLLEADDRVLGLYKTTIEISVRGVEHFQIIADENPDMTFYPENASRIAMVKGPEAQPGEEYSWWIQGMPGDKFVIEFYRSESDRFTVNWVSDQSGDQSALALSE